MKAMLDVGGPGVAIKRHTDLAERIYPLHPSVIPVLIRLFNRFGQNERSLFSFLLSNEPFGLQDFARRPLGDGDFYRIHNLYDYARSTFGYRLSLQSFRSHWNHIESMVGSFVSDQRGGVEVLKTPSAWEMGEWKPGCVSWITHYDSILSKNGLLSPII